MGGVAYSNFALVAEVPLGPRERTEVEREELPETSLPVPASCKPITFYVRENAVTIRAMHFPLYINA